MENTSHRRLSEEDASCTANSMYLSFEADSTMSCYKTLEATTDISSMSVLAINDDHNDIKHMNSTLENSQDIKSPLKTVKKVEAICSPLKALPKNIMREYKALSSTPSREVMMKTVDVTRGSDPSGCIDLGVAFLGVEDEQPAYFPVVAKQQTRREDNKENTMPDSTSDGSTLSSSVDIGSSLVDKRMNSISTLLGDEAEGEKSVSEKPLMHSNYSSGLMVSEESKIKPYQGDVLQEAKLETTPKAKDHELGNIEEMEGTVHVLQKDTIDCNPREFYKGTILEDNETSMELTPKAAELAEAKKSASGAKAIASSKIATFSIRNARRTVSCVPNLQTNKPSRISAVCNRQSLLPLSDKNKTASKEAENEIPLLMDKILKITKSSETKKQNSNVDIKGETKDTNLSKNEITTNVKIPLKPSQQDYPLPNAPKIRNSLAPFNVGDKRPFSFAQRMSVVVRTTLNSPARKLVRKSMLGFAPNQRTIMSSKSTQTMRMNKIDTGVRQSMVPNPKSNPLTAIKETAMTQQQKSIIPRITSVGTKGKDPLLSGVRPKPDATFTCNVCQEKFSLKSLLDAHKRSHEGNFIAPIVRKQSEPYAPRDSNQCKYCDKKFALVRALHIHLLQNCPKIPPSEKRKLEYTEMNHVGKARLPSVFHHGGVSSSNATSTQATPRGVLKPIDPLQIPISTKKKDPEKKSSESSQGTNIKATTAGSSQKLKKPSAHSGVYRTPSKTVPCHICKINFKSVLDFTDHNLAIHGNKTHQKKTDITGNASPTN